MSNDEENEEIFLTSCDLTIKPDKPMTQMKGCIIKNSTITDDNDETEPLSNEKVPLWKKIILCKPCIDTLQNAVWTISVRCARIAPGVCYFHRICSLLDMVSIFSSNHQISLSFHYFVLSFYGFFYSFEVAVIKAQKEQHEWRVKTSKITPQKIPLKG